MSSEPREVRVTAADVHLARERLGTLVMKSPLVRLDIGPGPELWLKLENLHPIGSFKVRGAGNAMVAAAADVMRQGVVTASAGNMAQGVAWWARRLGVGATAIVPDRAPDAKTSAIERLGGRVVRVSFDEWWSLIDGSGTPPVPGWFVHPVADPLVVAGNGTLALELVETLPRIDTVLVPWGGGGLACGIAAVLAEHHPEARVIGCEVATATPLTASLGAGKPVTVDHAPSFVDGIGGKSVLPAMWPLTQRLITGAAVVSLEAIRGAIRLLAARAHVVAEGAGAASLAAALDGHAQGVTVCVVSGGNIEPTLLAEILAGH